MSTWKLTKLSPARARKYRVVQWGAGNIGTRAMRAVIEHPDMTLVGLKEVGEKVGRDAGELCGAGPIGVIATESIDDIIALKPDCILYMQQGCNFDDICRLLSSGANIVTTRGEFLNPAMIHPDIRKRVEEACRSGRTSIHSTGSSPGFISEAIPFVLTSIARRLDCLTINEFADLSMRASPETLFDIIGFGKAAGKLDDMWLDYFKGNYGPAISLVADAIGLPLDSLEASGEVAVARDTTRIAAGVLEAGTVAAIRLTVSGIRNGRPLLRFRATWYCIKDIDASWELRDTGWHVVVEGDTPLDVKIEFPVSPEQYADFSPGLTAHRAVNAVPFVCAASPGIRTSVDLPQIITKLG